MFIKKDAFKNGLRKPIVNLWVKYFMLNWELLSNLNIQSPSFKYISTIDIDNATFWVKVLFVQLHFYLDLL